MSFSPKKQKIQKSQKSVCFCKHDYYYFISFAKMKINLKKAFFSELPKFSNQKLSSHIQKILFLVYNSM